MATKRFRERFTFWLDTLKDDEFQLAEEISRLKRDRSFVGTIRDGLRLILDLRAKRVGVLFELFPWLKDELPSPPPSGDDELRRRLEAMEQLLLANFRDSGLKMVDSKVIPFRATTPKPVAIAPVVIEDMDTSEAFLNAF